MLQRSIYRSLLVFCAVLFFVFPGRPVQAGPPAPAPKTGQTTSYGAGDDGALRKGVAWPNPRFTDNGDGTITDNLSGLIWLKNANCYGQKIWATALTDATALAHGSCGLSDLSTAGQWRLPTANELRSLTSKQYVTPAVPNTAGTAKWTAGAPFTSVQSAPYWSSTTYAGNTPLAWIVFLSSGDVGTNGKAGTGYVWPVRGGQ